MVVAEDLNRSVKRGVGWLLVERVTLQALSLLSSVILARLLAPRDFGVVGVAVLFTGLASRLVYFGFGMALVQRETIRRDHIAAMFVLSLGINAVLWLGLTIASPWVGAIFRDRLAGQALAVLSLNFLIRSIGVCPSALLRRAMNFRVITYGSILDLLVKILVAIVLAWKGMGFWSLVYGELAGGLAEKIYLFVASGWWPDVRMSRAALRDLFGFGMGISFKSTLIYLYENADNYVVGRALGTTALGFYEKAYNLMNLPVRELSARMTSVLFPVFARIHRERGRLRAAFMKTTLSLSLLSYPVFASLILLAPEIIRVLYGSQWAATVFPFQILCLAGVPRILTQVASSVVNATGAVAPEVTRRGFVFVLLVAGAIVGARWGITGVAVAVALVNFTTGILMLLLLTRLSSVAVKDLLRAQRLPLAASVSLVVVGWSARWALTSWLQAGALIVLLVSLPLAWAAYLGVLFALRDEALKRLARELATDLRPLQSLLPTGWRARVGP